MDGMLRELQQMLEAAELGDEGPASDGEGVLS